MYVLVGGHVIITHVCNTSIATCLSLYYLPLLLSLSLSLFQTPTFLRSGSLYLCALLENLLHWFFLSCVKTSPIYIANMTS